MASQTARGSSSAAVRPVAVVAPCQRRPTHVFGCPGTDTTGQTSRCDDDDETSTESQAHQGASENNNVFGRVCSESARDSRAWSVVDVDRREGETSTCAAKPYRRSVQSDDDDLATCAYYHGNITSDEAKRRLADHCAGTYLLRDSQSSHFPFSLSVQRTAAGGRSGVTSLRIARDGDGGFRLDCDEAHRILMPKFTSVRRLLRHFTAEADGGEGGRCLLVQVASSRSQEQPLTLRRPLHRPTADDDVN